MANPEYTICCISRKYSLSLYMHFDRMRFREMRYNKGFTQKDLAKSSHCTQMTISYIESGRLPNPGIGLICKLATILKCTPNDFIKL